MFKKQKSRKDKDLSDEELVIQLQKSMDADRFGHLYDRYSTLVYQKCLGMTRDADLAKDLTHDIFLKAFVNLSKFDHRSKFGTWLYRITYNYCLDHLRKEKRRPTEDIDGHPISEDMHENSYETELLAMRAENLNGVLEALDPTDRALLLMKYMEDLSVKEIQEVLTLSESAVKMRMLRAREKALLKYRELYPEEA